MLDVERGVDVDAGAEQLLDVEKTLGMASSGRVGMSELIDQHELRPAPQDGIEIHLLQGAAPVIDLAAGYHLEPGEQRFGLAPAVTFDQADDDIDAFAILRLRRLQHLVSLADPRWGAQ